MKQSLSSEEKRQSRTYAVRGLTDYEMSLKVGRASITISFTGGATSGYGVTPATITTDNPMVQRLIEKSPLFLCGRIYLLRSR